MGRTILLRLLDSYFRHRWLYLIPILVLTVFGAVYVLTQERYFISSGVIFTEQTSLLSSLTAVENEGFSWNTPAQDVTNEITDLIKTDAFIRAVIGETDLELKMSQGDEIVKDTITEVRKRIWVVPAGSNQVQINGANQDPVIAYQLAQSTINTFIQWNINLDRSDSTAAVNFFQELIMDYQSDAENAQQALRSYLDQHPEPLRGERSETEKMEIQNLQTKLDFATTRLAQALDKAENARLAEIQVESEVHQKYTLVDSPDIPTKAALSKRQMATNIAMFLVAGIIFSIVAVVGSTMMERSFRLPVDVERELGLPVLATLLTPMNSGWKIPFRKQRKKGFVAANDPVPDTQESEDLPIPFTLQKSKEEIKQSRLG